MLVRRHGVLHAHHELDMRRRGHQPGIDEPAGAMDVGEIEDLDLGRDGMLLHARRQIDDQRRMVSRRRWSKIDGARRERGHVGPMDEAEAPRAGSRPRPPVENCTIMPGQCLRTPSCTAAKRSGSDEELSSSLRTWIWTSVAPASKRRGSTRSAPKAGPAARIVLLARHGAGDGDGDHDGGRMGMLLAGFSPGRRHPPATRCR